MRKSAVWHAPCILNPSLYDMQYGNAFCDVMLVCSRCEWTFFLPFYYSACIRTAWPNPSVTLGYARMFVLLLASYILSYRWPSTSRRVISMVGLRRHALRYKRRVYSVVVPLSQAQLGCCGYSHVYPFRYLFKYSLLCHSRPGGVFVASFISYLLYVVYHGEVQNASFFLSSFLWKTCGKLAKLCGKLVNISLVLNGDRTFSWEHANGAPAPFHPLPAHGTPATCCTFTGITGITHYIYIS